MQPSTTNQKRKQLALRYFTYGVMSLAVILISTFCILWALGYRFDFLHRTVEQGALLQYRSFPTNAALTLDDGSLSFRTPGKSTVSDGKHSVTMNLEGYREWSKAVDVTAGELRWLNYARLIPSTVTTSSLKDFSVISGSLPTPDRKWMAVYTEPEKAELTIADLRDPAKIAYQTIALPGESFTTVAAQPHHFSLVEWDFGGRFLLVKHTTGDHIEFIRIDRTAAAPPINITTKLNFPITDIHFSGTSGNIFYAQDNTDLRRLDIAAGTISQPIATGVSRFVLYKTDTVIYTSNKDDTRKVGVYTDGQETAKAVREYDVTQPVLADITEYFSDTYAAIARGTQVEIIKNPQDKTTVSKSYTSFTVPTSVQWLRFSNNGRFVVAGNGTQYVTYDLETKETFAVNLPGTPTDPTKPLQWLDDYTLVSTADGNIRFSEFDGGNQQVITDSEPGFPVTLTPDQEFLISVTRTSSGFSLQSSRMVIN